MNYCERDNLTDNGAFEPLCSECSLRNYGRDCRNNPIGAAGVSAARCVADDRERRTAGILTDRYGNRIVLHGDMFNS